MHNVDGYRRIDVNEHIILGTEVLCPDGLGRISKVIGEGCCTRLEVKTYVNNRSCHWDPINVLIKN